MAAHLDERFMQVALVDAKKAIGRTSPNPAVGAVLVLNGRPISKGHHRGAGHPHAEVECLQSVAKPVPKTAILYATLEPCSTTGRTPPCTRAILDAGVRTVVVGAVDPNPLHSGRGIEELREAGVVVRVGVLEAECTALNEVFNHWIQTKRPFVIAKCGMTLDGRLTRPLGENRWITSALARAHANRLRHQVDAILIGAETLRADNPHLTARGVRGARQPRRVVITRSGRLPKGANLFTDQFAKETIVFRNQPLDAILAELGRQDITSVLIEGGGDVLGQALDARLVNRVHIYLAPLMTGGPVVAFASRGADSTHTGARLRDVKYEKIGRDIFVTGQTAYPESISE